MPDTGQIACCRYILTARSQLLRAGAVPCGVLCRCWVSCPPPAQPPAGLQCAGGGMPLCPGPGSPHSCAGGHLGWRPQVGLHLPACLLSLWGSGAVPQSPALHTEKLILDSSVLLACELCSNEHGACLSSHTGMASHPCTASTASVCLVPRPLQGLPSPASWLCVATVLGVTLDAPSLFIL